jgi:hypothetical protein
MAGLIPAVRSPYPAGLEHFGISAIVRFDGDQGRADGESRETPHPF